jgi:hypothetical protein
MQDMRFMKVLKKLIIVSIAAGSLGLVLALLLWNLYSTYLPHVPDPATGRVYRLVQHDLVVYQTKKEHILYWSVNACSFIFFGLSVLWIVIHDRISDKKDRRTD